MYYLYLLRNGQSSDNSIVRKNEQPQLPTQNKLPPCSGHSSDLKISLESGHSSDLKISLQGFHSFQTDFHNCSPSPTYLSVAMEISRMPLPHFEKKNESLTLPSHNCSLWSASISFSLSTSAYKPMYYLYLLRNGQSSDNSIFGKTNSHSYPPKTSFRLAVATHPT